MRNTKLVSFLLVLGLSLVAPPLRGQTIGGAAALPSQTGLTLPPGNSVYIYGMATGGLYPSSPFSQGNTQQLLDASGLLVADLAVTQSNFNSFGTNALYYTIGGIGVSGFTTMSQSFGSNNNPGASSASDTFTVTQQSLVVVVVMAGGQSYLTLSGLQSLQFDAQVGSQSGGVIGMVIAHASLSPGTYTVTENSFPSPAPGQDPNHMADLIGVFVFSGQPKTVSLQTACVNGLQVDINGAASPGASVTNISWNWGDGTTTTGFFPQSHTYASSGSYYVQVTANYNDGTSASSSQTVSVAPGALSNCVPLTITAGQYGSVNYQASVGSGVVPPGSYVTLQMDFADDLTLNANPDPAFSFSSWSASGAITGVNGTPINTASQSILLVVGAASTINANFALSLTLPPTPTATPPLSSFPSVPQLFTNQAASFSTLFANQTSSNSQSWLTSSSIVTNISAATNILSLSPPTGITTNNCAVSSVKQDLCTISTASNQLSTILGLASIPLDPLSGVAFTAAGLLLSTSQGQQDLNQFSGLAGGTGLLLDGASIAGSCILASGQGGFNLFSDAGCILSIGSGFADVTSQVSSLLVALDPPDPNYTQVFVPQPITVTPVALVGIPPSLRTASWASINAVDETTMWMNAVRVTVNRYSTAVANGDAASAGIQYMAFLNYFGLYLQAAGNASVDLTRLANLLTAQGLGTQEVTSQQIQRGLTFLETQGASSPFINTFFTSLGFTPEQVQTMIYQAQAHPPSPPSATPVQALRSLAEAFAPPGVDLAASVNSIMLDSVNHQWVLSLNIVNKGTSTATNLTLTAAELNGTSTKTALPDSIGGLPYARSATVTLTFPAWAGAPGRQSTLKVSETYSGGTAQQILAVTLP